MIFAFEIQHLDITSISKSKKSVKKTVVIHGQTVGRDGARTLCGEDTSGDSDRVIIGKVSKKITCEHCIELITGIYRHFSISDLDPKAIAKNRSASKWIEEIANR